MFVGVYSSSVRFLVMFSIEIFIYQAFVSLCTYKSNAVSVSSADKIYSRLISSLPRRRGVQAAERTCCT